MSVENCQNIEYKPSVFLPVMTSFDYLSQLVSPRLFMLNFVFPLSYLFFTQFYLIKIQFHINFPLIHQFSLMII